MKSIQARVERAKRAILKDIEEGTLPETVQSFEDLHEYIDANVYLNEDFQEPATEENVAIWNEVSEKVDEWLKAGRK